MADDLTILDWGTRRSATEIKTNNATNPHDAPKLEAILDDIRANAGWLVGING